MNTYRWYSDLHGVLPEETEGEADEICILAGDLDEFRKKGLGLYSLLSKMCDRFKEVIFIPGNHEYYGTNIGTLESKLSILMEDEENFTLLQNGSYVERDGVRIIGATMWSDPTGFESEIESGMNDYRYIRHGPDDMPWKYRLKPSVTYGIHLKHVKAIEEALLNHDGECIVVTHHAPSRESLDPRYEGSLINKAFYTDIVLRKWPSIWIHGHIHRWSDYKLGECRVLCNPGGYRGEYTAYSQINNVFTL